MDWRVLVVDDTEANDIIEVIGGNKTVALPDSINCVSCENFSQAIELLKVEKFDLIILDLKDDKAPESEILAGEKVFEDLKNHRFIPVVFHTGFSHKVSDLASPFVKVVTRSDWVDLRSKIKEVLDTKLPKLVRHIEEEQRKFMWESAEKIWVDDLGKSNPTDLVYLLARRLSNSLSSDMVRSFFGADAANGIPKSEKIHAVELYVYPPISNHFLFGDIFKKENSERPDFFVAITPSCDHAQGKSDFVLLAKCKYLVDTGPGANAKQSIATNAPISGTIADKLEKYIRDNSTPVDRYKYLPGTSFLPDLLIDLQDITTVAPASLNPEAEEYERIASLDSPFAESLQAKLVRYLGRIGTPDIDPDLAFERFKVRIK